MVGLPLPITIWIYSSFYPINKDEHHTYQGPMGTDPMYQHFFILILGAWLLIVGPREKLFDGKKTKANGKS